MTSNKLAVIIDRTNRAWLHRYHRCEYSTFITDTIVDDYHLMINMPPVRSFMIDIDPGRFLRGRLRGYIDFITTNNKWIRLYTNSPVIRTLGEDINHLEDSGCNRVMIIVKIDYSLYLCDKDNIYPRLLMEGVLECKVYGHQCVILIMIDGRILLSKNGINPERWITSPYRIGPHRIMGSNRIITRDEDVYWIKWGSRNQLPVVEYPIIPPCLDYITYDGGCITALYIDCDGKLWSVSNNHKNNRIEDRSLEGKKLSYFIKESFNTVIIVDQEGDSWKIHRYSTGNGNGNNEIYRQQWPQLLDVNVYLRQIEE